jgi:hypothetical protein
MLDRRAPSFHEVDQLCRAMVDQGKTRLPKWMEKKQPAELHPSSAPAHRFGRGGAL